MAEGLYMTCWGCCMLWCIVQVFKGVNGNENIGNKMYDEYMRIADVHNANND